MDTPPRTVAYRIDATVTPAVVEVDGVDIAEQISGVTVHLGYGQPTRLLIEEQRPGSLTGTAIVEVTRTGQDPVDAIRALDPAVVEEAVMASDLPEDTMAGNYLAVIADMVGRNR